MYENAEEWEFAGVFAFLPWSAGGFSGLAIRTTYAILK